MSNVASVPERHLIGEDDQRTLCDMRSWEAWPGLVTDPKQATCEVCLLVHSVEVGEAVRA